MSNIGFDILTESSLPLSEFPFDLIIFNKVNFNNILKI